MTYPPLSLERQQRFSGITSFLPDVCVFKHILFLNLIISETEIAYLYCKHVKEEEKEGEEEKTGKILWKSIHEEGSLLFVLSGLR